MGRKKLTEEERKAKIYQRNNDYKKRNPEKINALKRAWYQKHKKEILAYQKVHLRLIKLGLKQKGPPRKKKGGISRTPEYMRKHKQKSRDKERAEMQKKIIDDYNKKYG